MKDICLEEARTQTGNVLDGNYCNGKSCNKYETCVGRIEFDKLPKRTPTAYEIQEAIRREILHGEGDKK